MRWLKTEYVLKGIYLGLLLFVARNSPSWQATAGVVLATVANLAIALGVAAFSKLREGYQVRGRLLAFVLFLLLESPTLVYAGIITGTGVGAGWFALLEQDLRQEFLICVAGGAVLGIVFGLLRSLRDRRVRLGLSLALAATLVLGALYLFGHFEEFKPVHVKNLTNLSGIQLLLGIPIFYLLTFAGREEESEVEIGAMCAALGLGLWILTHKLSTTTPFLVFAIPLVLYFVYTKRILPGLRVAKHALRGYSYARIGRYRQALISFRRAVQLDPQNKLARDGLWSIHKSLDLTGLANDPETLALIDLDLCLERVSSLLLEPGPTPAKLEEAHRLLDLVLNQRPAAQPRVAYWRAVAFTHARLYDRAAAELAQLLDCTFPADRDERQAVLLPAWQLALTLHDELRRRVGMPQLALPDRRMEAITTVEQHLKAKPDDPSVWELKKLLYAGVTEAEYDAAVGAGQTAAYFDHAHVQQLGLKLIDDSTNWQRGGECLRLAARGLPALGPSLFTQIARACDREGNPDQAWHNYELAVRAGRSAGVKNLSDEERQLYFATVKMLADAFNAQDQLDKAIENYHLYTESDRSGLETYRKLADLYERKGKPVPALWATEQALIYDSKDKDLLERKDRCYYSVMPGNLQVNLEALAGAFDLAYCLRKARSLLDTKSDDLELVDWADHLVQLALVVQPEGLTGRVLKARACLRRGEKGEAVAILEAVHSPKPEKFASTEEEESWFLSCRLLGELYLYELGKPELAVTCFNEYRKSSKSGADTLFKLGQAYEQLGDSVRAKKCYEHVISYDSHPLAPEAREALYRLQGN